MITSDQSSPLVSETSTDSATIFPTITTPVGPNTPSLTHLPGDVARHVARDVSSEALAPDRGPGSIPSRELSTPCRRPGRGAPRLHPIRGVRRVHGIPMAEDGLGSHPVRTLGRVDRDHGWSLSPDSTRGSLSQDWRGGWIHRRVHRALLGADHLPVRPDIDPPGDPWRLSHRNQLGRLRVSASATLRRRARRPYGLGSLKT